MRLSTTETYENLKSALAKLSGVDESALLIAEITNGAIRVRATTSVSALREIKNRPFAQNVPKDSQKIKMGANYLYAYEIPDVVDEEEEEETTVVVKEEIEDVGEVETQTDDGDETAGDDPTEEDSSLAPLTNNDDGGKEKSTGDDGGVVLGDESPDVRRCCFKTDWTEVTDHPLSPTRTQAESSVDDDKEETSPSPSSMSMTCSYLVAVNRKMVGCNVSLSLSLSWRCINSLFFFCRLRLIAISFLIRKTVPIRLDCLLSSTGSRVPNRGIYMMTSRNRSSVFCRRRRSKPKSERKKRIYILSLPMI